MLPQPFRLKKVWYGSERFAGSYLDDIINGSGVFRPFIPRVDTVEPVPWSKHVDILRWFFGLSGYYRKFIPSFFFR